MTNIAIIGAGVSGLAAAYRLERAGVSAKVFEKSRGFSGRAASRTRHGCRFDYGANYFKVTGEAVRQLLFDDLPADELCRVDGDIGTFDERGTIRPGDPGQNAADKWTYRSGISTLGKLLVEAGGIDVTRETRITRCFRREDRWWLCDDKGETYGPFDRVLLTAPAPQTAELLESAGTESGLDGLIAELRRSRYHCQFTVALNYSGGHSLPGDHYALINTDRRHPVAWLSHENRKPGRVPDGQTLLLAQLAPAWSADHFDDDHDEVVSFAAEAVAKLLVEQALPAPQWSDSMRWKFAHPHSAVSVQVLAAGEALGLYFAGDALVGKGRVAESIDTGLAAARRMLPGSTTTMRIALDR